MGRLQMWFPRRVDFTPSFAPTQKKAAGLIAMAVSHLAEIIGLAEINGRAALAATICELESPLPYHRIE